jgi:hypothetical protein
MARKALGLAVAGPTELVTLADIAEGFQWWQTSGVRAVGIGQQLIGLEIPYPIKITRLSYPMGTADASGTTTVELRKNGITGAETLSGTSGTAAVTPTALTGLSIDLAAGDLLWAYVTAVGTTPGTGLAVRLRGRRL